MAFFDVLDVLRFCTFWAVYGSELKSTIATQLSETTINSFQLHVNYTLIDVLLLFKLTVESLRLTSLISIFDLGSCGSHGFHNWSDLCTPHAQ